MAVPATNVIEQTVHVVRTKQSNVSDECDIDDLIADLERSHDLKAEMSSARQWLAEDLPESLAQLRLKKGMSQSQLATAVGLRQPNISAIESGKRKPEYETARKISDVLGVSTDEFYAAFNLSA